MGCKVGIDIDGFLTDISTFQLENGVKYFDEVKNPKGYYIRDIFECSKKEETKFWCKNAKYYMQKPRVNADKFTHYLHDIGAEVYIITSRAHTHKNTPVGAVMRHAVRTWLRNNNIYYDKLVFCDEDKIRTIKRFDIDYMGEDSPITSKEISKYIPVLLMSAPYNDDIRNDNIYLINNFNEAIDIFDNVLKPKKKK